MMLAYLRHDPTVYSMMKPNKPLLRKMNLERHILSKNKEESEQSLELGSFLLRYHANIDYGDFSDDPFTILKLRRYEDVKYAAELEALSKNHEDLESRLEELRLQGVNTHSVVESKSTGPVMFENNK